MGIIIGIDASRGRSGGSKAHLIGILSELNPLPKGIDKIHIWSYSSLLDSIPNSPWLIKHNPPQLEKSLLYQVLWQRFFLSKQAKTMKCDVLLNTDAGTVGTFKPYVVMSRDMLPFQPNEMGRYGISLLWLRLFLLRYIHVKSMKMADGVIFLNIYAANVIQEFTGKLKNIELIPHGINDTFRRNGSDGMWSKGESDVIKCLYVSNIDVYKHQNKVVKGVAALRDKGYRIELYLAGEQSKRPIQKIVNQAILNADPSGEYIFQLGKIQHNNVPGLLKTADIFIFASSCENMPNTLIEAMSSGLPIACSDRGPMPEILKDGGVYFDPEDPVSIAAAIKKIIDNKVLRLSISKKAKDLSNSFSWSKCANETLGFLIKTASNFIPNYTEIK